MDLEKRISMALKMAENGCYDGAHHKMWVIDQMIRCLTGSPQIVKEGTNYKGAYFRFVSFGESDEYKKWVSNFCNGEDGPDTYEWDTGTPP